MPGYGPTGSYPVAAPEDVGVVVARTRAPYFPHGYFARRYFCDAYFPGAAPAGPTVKPPYFCHSYFPARFFCDRYFPGTFVEASQEEPGVGGRPRQRVVVPTFHARGYLRLPTLDVDARAQAVPAPVRGVTDTVLPVLGLDAAGLATPASVGAIASFDIRGLAMMGSGIAAPRMPRRRQSADEPDEDTVLFDHYLASLTTEDDDGS